jgi:hypothetical protein
MSDNRIRNPAVGDGGSVLRDVRKRLKAERNYYQRDEVQACRVCGRYFTKHARDAVCSAACKEKATERDKKSSWRGD